MSKKEKSVLGQYTGKCCDSNVFNNNDMHLSDVLFKNLMESDEYKRAMENHHYIGYLGHPADPDCQDFEHACIVMKDMRLLPNGEIEGDFDLVDTPVGRIVKSFIDAGVKFGISIRGLGEVAADGEVDPEQFVFRGFDLVTFPAYDDCIPEFREIAASTDMKKKAAYKKICASINNNLKSIRSSEALHLIQEQLEDGCEEYNIIQDRIDELAEPDVIIEENVVDDVMQEKLDAVTELYLEAEAKVKELEEALFESETCNNELAVECKTTKAQFARLRRIVANQLDTARDVCEDASELHQDLKRQLRASNSQLTKVKASLDTTRKELSETQRELDRSKQSYERAVTANTKLRRELNNMTNNSDSDRKAIEAAESLNLKYKRKIEANSEVISQKDSTIEDLKAELHETVVAKKQLESKASNLDVKNGELLSRVEAAEEMVFNYQQAYANMYANALGVYLKDLPITADTSVDQLKQMISAGTSTANIGAAPSYYDDDEAYDDEELSFEGYNAEMVTL